MAGIESNYPRSVIMSCNHVVYIISCIVFSLGVLDLVCCAAVLYPWITLTLSIPLCNTPQNPLPLGKGRGLSRVRVRVVIRLSKGLPLQGTMSARGRSHSPPPRPWG